MAEASGFANANYFAKVFRRETGLSPSEYLAGTLRRPIQNIPRCHRHSGLTLLLSLCGCAADDGETHLTFQIWDVYQRNSMEAICAAYMEKNPDVVIDVQVTNWNEYWIKLEAAAESNTMPDIFWMHTNQILYYTEFGMLADVTNLYDDVDPQYDETRFSDISIGNAQASTAGCTARLRTRQCCPVL